MEARNRSLEDWFTRVRTGQVRLPRFQRYEAWGHGEVAALLEAVLRGLPSGAVLVLEVGDHEPFVSRTMVGAPAPTERVVEQLLDGQQRLTGLWRSLNNDYPDRTYLVRFEDDEEHDGQVPAVYGQSRYYRNGQRYPLWVDDPVQVHERGFLPLLLCRPGDLGSEIKDWCQLATSKDNEAAWALSERITELRKRVTTYNIPFLSLPAQTPRDVALDVFIKLNTSSVKLSAFDIVVAQFEEATGQSLHELVEEVHSSVPGLRRYRRPEDLVLDVAALRSDRRPSQASYQQLDLTEVAKQWDEIIDGLAWTVSFLEDEKVFDGERLPSVAVLPVLAALHPHLPKSLDALGNARSLLRKYLWRAFLTPRYESSAGTRALQDYRGLRSLLGGGSEPPPIFDEDQYPLPDQATLLRAGWPKTKETVARGIMAMSLRAGGRDLADGTAASIESLPKREYHHLFPDSLIQGAGEMPVGDSYRALNCALVTWNTNRNISAKAPLVYLRERVERGVLGEDAVRDRLSTHLIPYESLAQAGFEGLKDDELGEAIRSSYEQFLNSRAALMVDYAAKLCDGQEL